MRTLTQFSSFDEYYRINEDVNAAKSYLFNKFADRIERIDLNPEELNGSESEEELLRKKQQQFLRDNNDYQEILKIVGDNRGYVGPFTKFRFEHNAPLRGRWVGQEPNRNHVDGLDDLYNAIKKYPDALPKPGQNRTLLNFPMTLDQYANSERANGVNSFEAIMDQFNTIEDKREARWVIEGLPKNLRNRVKALPIDEQIRLINAAIAIDGVDKDAGTYKVQAVDRNGNPVFNPDGTPLMRDMNSRIETLDKARAYEDWSAEEYVEYLINRSNQIARADIKDMLKQLKAVVPEAGLLYVGQGFLALSVRTEEAQKKLCAIANWCINRGAWNTYGGQPNNLQINIFDFNRSINDPMFITGTTPNFDRKVLYSHNKPDDPIIKSPDVIKHFTLLGYPKELVNAIDSKFDSECVVKKLVTSLKLNGLSPYDLLKSIVLASYGRAVDLEKDEFALQSILDIINTRVIEADERGDIDMDAEVHKLYSKVGIATPFSARLFNKFYGDLTPEERKQWVEYNIAFREKSGEYFGLYSIEKYPELKDAFEIWKKSVASADEVDAIILSGETFSTLEG